jgi:hypothetical protein
MEIPRDPRKSRASNTLEVEPIGLKEKGGSSAALPLSPAFCEMLSDFKIDSNNQ